MLGPEELKRLLGLQPHPAEGGFFAETYRAEEHLAAPLLPARYQGDRPTGTAIYYLITPETFSAMHRLETDEIFHFYLGDPVEMLQLMPDGSGRLLLLGNDLAAGQRPQVVLPRGVWQGSRLCFGGAYALLGTTMAPGFDYADYTCGKRSDLIARYPEFRDVIRALTREA